MARSLDAKRSGPERMHVSRRKRHARPLASLILATCFVASCGSGSGGGTATTSTATVGISMLDNGDFAAKGAGFRDGDKIERIPWWRSARGMDQLQSIDGRNHLGTRTGEWASQPIAAYAPLIDGLVVRGNVAGLGVVELTDGSGTAVAFEVGVPGEQIAFEITGPEYAARLRRAPVPRLVLKLYPADGEPVTWWSDLEVVAEHPLPTEDELRAEVTERLEWIFDLWLERGLDDEGEVKTGFWCHVHDVISGERLFSIKGGYNPFFHQLLYAVELTGNPRLRKAFVAHFESLLEHAIHPRTGLPRFWDAESDKPIDGHYIEIGLPLRFLIDVAEEGPEELRERALAAAKRIGETVLKRGLLPDGNVAPKYRPSDGSPSSAASPLRTLDVPAQLGRLGALLDDDRYTRAARRALSRFEYTHLWAGSWEYLDPGFDDQFGTYAQRAVTLWEAHPSERAFRHFAMSGVEYFTPRWRDAVRLGGMIAVDEVRCWEIYRRVARLEPSMHDEVGELLDAALRAHYKGEQYPNGAWGDVIHYFYDPKIGLEMGDLPVMPQNLLQGIAVCYEQGLPTRSKEELRAMYASVLRTTFETYGRPHGLLSTMTERRGQNAATGSVRLLRPLVEMLRALTPKS